MSNILRMTQKRSRGTPQHGVRRRSSPPSRPVFSPVTSLATLHHTLGNQAVQRMIQAGTLQARLQISQPNDKYEQQADRVAERVMRMAEPETQRDEEEELIQGQFRDGQNASLVQRQAEEEDEEEEEPIQAKLAEDSPVMRQEEEPEEEEEAPIQLQRIDGNTLKETGGLETQLRTLQGTGSPLSQPLRRFFEPRFGYDLSQVRIHTEPRAAHVARQLHARAFTRGRHVVFGPGQFSPSTASGKRLLAHELTHVAQQQRLSRSLISSVRSVQTPRLLPHQTLQREETAPTTTTPRSSPRAGFSSTLRICHRFLRSRDLSVSSGSVTVSCSTYWTPARCRASSPSAFYITLVKKGWILNSGQGSRRYPVGSHSASWSDLASGTYFLQIWFPANTNPHCCLEGTIRVST